MLEMVREHTAARAIAPPLPACDDAPDLDEPHRAIWEAVRDEFPPSAVVTQVDHACLLVAWKLRGGPRHGTHFAAPVIIRIEPGLLLALWTCDPWERGEIARLQADKVRDALEGYNPRSRIPTCGVIRLGD